MKNTRIVAKNGKKKGKTISDRRDLLVCWAGRRMKALIERGNRIGATGVYNWTLGRLKNWQSEADKLTEIYIELMEL